MFVVTLSQFPEFKELMPEPCRPPGPELKPKSLWTPCLCVVRGCTLDVFFRIAAIKRKRRSMLSAPNLSLWLFWKCPNGFLLVNHRGGGAFCRRSVIGSLLFPSLCLVLATSTSFFFFPLPPDRPEENSLCLFTTLRDYCSI